MQATSAKPPGYESASSPELGIVIPAYKTRFLRETLQSIARQTDQRFQLYVGDDASPEPVAAIVREFSEKLPVKYHRFERNLGGDSLVRHWERCIRLAREPWVWLFSDDDFLEPTCVAAFFAELEKTGGQHDLYRFNTHWLNSVRNTTEASPFHPLEETGADFLVARLRGGRRSTFQELVFSRPAWAAAGGIPDFPLAWASDDAFIAKMGGRRPIKTIRGPRVTWRLSDLNISNDNASATFRIKLKASGDFIRWSIVFLEQQPPTTGKMERREILQLTEHWFFKCFVNHSWRFLDLKACREIERFAQEVWGHKTGGGFLRALQANAAHFQRKCAEKMKP